MKRKFQHRGWACAISREEAYALYEHYHELLDDVDEEMRQNAKKGEELMKIGTMLKEKNDWLIKINNETVKFNNDITRELAEVKRNEQKALKERDDARKERDDVWRVVDRLTAEMRMRCAVCTELKTEWVVSTRCGHTLCLQCATMPVCLRACPFCYSKDPLWMRIYPGTTEKD